MTRTIWVVAKRPKDNYFETKQVVSIFERKIEAERELENLLRLDDGFVYHAYQMHTGVSYVRMAKAMRKIVKGY